MYAMCPSQLPCGTQRLVISLELKPSCEVHQSWIVVNDRCRPLAKRSGRCDSGSRLYKVGLADNVERFRAELQLYPFLDLQVLEQGQVKAMKTTTGFQQKNLAPSSDRSAGRASCCATPPKTLRSPVQDHRPEISCVGISSLIDRR